MARTTEQIHAELLDIAPTWFESRKYGSDFLDALAAVLSFVEGKTESLLSESFRLSATGEFLRTYARDIGVEPLLGETEASIRARSTMAPRGITETALQSQLDAITPEGFRVVLVEPRENVLDDGFFLDDYSATLVGDDTPHAFGWAHLPLFDLVLLRPEDRTFLDDETTGVGVGCFLDEGAFLDSYRRDTNRLIYKQLFGILETGVAWGVTWGATIDDYIQAAHLSLYEEIDQ